MTDRKKPGVAFWASVVMVVVLVAYPLSFGPACFLCEKGCLPQKTAWCLYRAWTWLAVYGPLPARRLIIAYARACGDTWRIELVGEERPSHLPPPRYCSYPRMVAKCRSDSVSPIDFEMAHE
jgi:hypothetical protein